MELKIIKYNNKYYSNSVNNRRSVYSFKNIKSAQNCCMYLANFKSRYNQYPYLINYDTPPTDLKLVESYNRTPLNYILVNEISLHSEESGDLLLRCENEDLGLVLVDNFNYFFSDNEISINFIACDLFTKDVFEYNHIEIT